MTINKGDPPRGVGLRRTVRALTVGVVGAAVMAAAGVTATMAYGQGIHEAAASISTDVTATSGTATASGATTPGASSTDSGSLTAPSQAPMATTGAGGAHAGSGGS